MHTPRIAVVTLAFGLPVGGIALGAPPATPPSASAPSAAGGSGRLVLKTRDVRMTRDERTTVLIFPGVKKVPFNKAADLDVDGRPQTIYIPKADKYTTKNTGRGESWLGNNSTRLFVDADGDGTLAENEGWFTSLPIRVGDRNYRVERIADGATQIELTLLDEPLTGLVIGRKAPPFRLTTADGQVVTQDDYKGRAFLLDIWSVT